MDVTIKHFCILLKLRTSSVMLKPCTILKPLFERNKKGVCLAPPSKQFTYYAQRDCKTLDFGLQVTSNFA